MRVMINFDEKCIFKSTKHFKKLTDDLHCSEESNIINKTILILHFRLDPELQYGLTIDIKMFDLHLINIMENIFP